ncbi:hypothetical protein [Marinobacter sp. CA1]|uniref:hypothetical protein n=1 Tax=Marinobacter sp. CA1 TaxID=2817656 RepID=UPI001D086740|nr:hypothetical protein [Marinobacter sp. CA1]MCG8516575.1 hypothetical protein [Pseudomonadales bacterium]UDL03952.1 hypothetical protein J2887_14680 [Marinobacter sp. CA1]
MDIYRNAYPKLGAVDRPRVDTGRRPAAADGSPAPEGQRIADRRLQPDRRRRQESFDGPDRRRRNSRRRPNLLDPKTRQAAALEDRRGRLVDAQA